MIEVITAFIVAFVFSFIGTIPPGSLNILIIQLGLEHKLNIAMRFALAVSIVEYPYAWAAVKFESLLTSSPIVAEYFQLITAIVMLVLGVLSLISAQRKIAIIEKFNESGFRRGLVLGILNPMPLPFWIAITAYIKSHDWTDISDNFELHAYLLGVSLGTLAVLILFAVLAKNVVRYFRESKGIRLIPGITLLVLAFYGFIQYFF